jgi:hypothetical protein
VGREDATSFLEGAFSGIKIISTTETDRKCIIVPSNEKTHQATVK